MCRWKRYNQNAKKKKIKVVYTIPYFIWSSFLWLLNNFSLFYKLEWNYTADSHSLDFKGELLCDLEKIILLLSNFLILCIGLTIFLILLAYFLHILHIFEILHYLLYNLNFIMYSTEFPFCDYFTNYFFLLQPYLSKSFTLFSWMFKCIIFFYLKNILYSIYLPHLPI